MSNEFDKWWGGYNPSVGTVPKSRKTIAMAAWNAANEGTRQIDMDQPKLKCILSKYPNGDDCVKIMFGTSTVGVISKVIGGFQVSGKRKPVSKLSDAIKQLVIQKISQHMKEIERYKLFTDQINDEMVVIKEFSNDGFDENDTWPGASRDSKKWPSIYQFDRD